MNVAYNMGCKKYFDEQEERFARYTAQMRVEGI